MKIAFDKTNNFWFDNAIIILHDVLLRQQFDGLKLQEDCLILEGEEDLIIKALNDAHQEIGKSYLRNTGNWGWIYKDGQFQLYQKQDFLQALKGFFTGKTGKPKYGSLEYPKEEEKFGSKGYMTVEQAAAFKIFAAENKEKKPADKGYLEEPPVYEFGEPFNTDYEKPGKTFCIFSGQAVKKASAVTGMNYPFLTGNSGEMNFASNLSASYKISGKLDFLSLFAFQGLYYHLNDADSGHFFMVSDGSLTKLYKFRGQLSKTFDSSENWRHNFKNEIIGTTLSQEALLGFIISMYSQVSDIREKLMEEVLTKSIYSFTKENGIFKEVQEFTALQKLFNLFININFNHFTVIFKQFFEKQSERKYDTTFRNRLAHCMLHFQSINGVVEQFLGSVKLGEQKGIPYLNEFIESYNIQILPNMDATKIKLCKDIGRTIGYYSADSKNRRLLYGLRNTRNRSDFLKVLSDAQFRIADHVKERNRPAQDGDGAEGEKKNIRSFNLYLSPDFFDQLPEDREWEEYKSLVSIFAMNYYLTAINQKSEKNEQ